MTAPSASTVGPHGWLTSWPEAARLFRAHSAAAYARLADDVAGRPAKPPAPPLVALQVVRMAALQGSATDPWTGDVGAFADDLTSLAGQVAAAGRRGLVQFTDPARMADILPGLLLTAGRYPGRPVHLVEMGSCAGLLLVPERYRINYPAGVWQADTDGITAGTVGLASALDVPAWLLARPLQIQTRAGVDLAPVDCRVPGALDYLRSYVWPGDPAREDRLARAAAAVAADRPTILAGDVGEVVPDLLADSTSRDSVTVLLDSATSHYLPQRSQFRLGRALDRLARAGNLVMISRGGGVAGYGEAFSGVRVVDLSGRWRMQYAVSDALSERSHWIGPREPGR